ncbi:MAG TPA: 2-C-methyl-D-erythritol 4-phosphate cytidylyltransferase [Ktedonobacterales bacterium]|nr:2-C-methyl-D-erythritol 4-phosphate cytidylyltransferase [Ktedonobacterales bacterium]
MQSHRKNVAIVLGAGQGTRMGADRNKVLLSLAGKPLLAYALGVFERAPQVDETLLVAHPDEIDLVQREVVAAYGLRKVRAVIAGGATRHQSEENALAALRPRIVADEIALILIHDGARPLLTLDEVARLIAAVAALGGPGGALLATPLAPDEVILRVGDDGAVTAVYAPGELARAQTPQAFTAQALLAAYDRARADGFEGTDTAAAVERLSYPVALVAGSADNIKVTTPDDLVRAEELLKAERDLTQ